MKTGGQQKCLDKALQDDNHAKILVQFELFYV